MIYTQTYCITHEDMGGYYRVYHIDCGTSHELYQYFLGPNKLLTI
jgi:hypothetical protein